MKLSDYVLTHTERGECQCGRCIDKGEAPDPIGHTVDIQFFKVASLNSPSADEFSRLTKEQKGAFVDVDPFDGGEHGYIELGGWIGDQGLALQYMALGVLLGVFELMTPANMLPGLPAELHNQMALQGMITIKAKRAA